MNEIARITIIVEELPEGAYISLVAKHGKDKLPIKPDAASPIYGNTIKQLSQRIAKRLEKLIVEED